LGYITSEVVLRSGTYPAPCLFIIDMKADFIRFGKETLSTFHLQNRYCFKMDDRQ
jgi:hypothetical protein